MVCGQRFWLNPCSGSSLADALEQVTFLLLRLVFLNLLGGNVLAIIEGYSKC